MILSRGPVRAFAHSTLAGLALAHLVLAAEARAQTYVTAFPGLTFSRPLQLEEVPGKPGHLLVLEQGGTLQLVSQASSVWTKTEFAKITVTGPTSAVDERGLLSFAFHPRYAENRRYFVYYTLKDAIGNANIIEERQADLTLDKDSGTPPKTILRIVDPYDNHNGGTIRFGKDGFLYLGTGDGGNFDDPLNNSQNTSSLLGKMLRLDVDREEAGKAYGIPTDNPFAAGGGAPEVYAWGLRNPFRWAFDPVTGDQWVADVGERAFEEVDLLRKGGNYGWDIAEGFDDMTEAFTAPVFSYGRELGLSVIGGYVFRGNDTSPFYGYFIFGDYGSRLMWGLRASADTSRVDTVGLAPSPAEIRGFGTDVAGNLYLMGGTTSIYRLSGEAWDARPASVMPQGHLKKAYGRLLSGRAGGRLEIGAAGAGSDFAGLPIYAMDGRRIGAVDPAGRLPEHLQAGMYLLGRAAPARSHLLLVR
jgi:glucose/arabinose dehydrogenase